MPAWVRAEPGGVRLALRVQPGARRCELVGEYAGRLKVAVQAPPIDGRANEALLGYLANCLDLRPGALRLIAGAASRDKSVLIECAPSEAPRIAQRLVAGLAR
ncbi:MAG TPA: DUF167 domain-containing protein [Burkholderiaceae bacterium]|nr:DUF167 domain-containing protein [Burkholderiaceae bacterium]